jgi:hypothetical protein
MRCWETHGTTGFGRVVREGRFPAGGYHDSSIGLHRDAADLTDDFVEVNTLCHRWMWASSQVFPSLTRFWHLSARERSDSTPATLFRHSAVKTFNPVAMKLVTPTTLPGFSLLKARATRICFVAPIRRRSAAPRKANLTFLLSISIFRVSIEEREDWRLNLNISVAKLRPDSGGEGG